jgi:hypothetical protein
MPRKNKEEAPMRHREYEFSFHRTIVLRYPLWVYVTTALSVCCAIASAVLRLT